MLRMLVLAVVEYIIIGCCVVIDPYEPKGKKRIKRFLKMLIWIMTAGMAYYFFGTDGEGKFFFFITCFMVVKYLLDIINPYLGLIFYLTLVYAIMGFILYGILYQQHLIIFGLGILILCLVTFSVWKEQLTLMIKGFDADIEYARSQEKWRIEKKRKRTKELFKCIWVIFKAWRL